MLEKLKDIRDGIRGSDNISSSPGFEDKNSFQYLKKTMDKQLSTVDDTANHVVPLIKALKQLNQLPDIFREFTKMTYQETAGSKTDTEHNSIDFLSRNHHHITPTTNKTPKPHRVRFNRNLR